MLLDVRDQQVTVVYVVDNPDKLRDVERRIAALR
jgi:hypothetical protein